MAEDLNFLDPDRNHKDIKRTRVYMDNAARTKMHPEALRYLNLAMLKCYGNPSTSYKEGRIAKSAMQWSREVCAKSLGATSPEEIVFTSCGTESNNIALRSCVASYKKIHPNQKCVIMTSSVEHSSVTKTAENIVSLDPQGCEHVRIPVETNGKINTDLYYELLVAHREQLAIVSIICGQNETGIVQDIFQLAQICRDVTQNRVPFHTDITQVVGKIPIKFILSGSEHGICKCTQVSWPTRCWSFVYLQKLQRIGCRNNTHVRRWARKWQEMWYRECAVDIGNIQGHFAFS